MDVFKYSKKRDLGVFDVEGEYRHRGSESVHKEFEITGMFRTL